MKCNLFRIIVLACLFAAGIICIPCQSAHAGIFAVATVIAERGMVSVERAGSAHFRALEMDDELYSGDLVKTSVAGEAEILFGDGSLIKLKSGTTVQIYSEKRTGRNYSLFQAIVGVVWAHLRPGQVVELPGADMEVRGTEVELAIADDGTSLVTVLDGDVNLYNSYGSVDLATGQQSTSSPGSAPTPPIAVDPTGLIGWTADVEGMPLVFEAPDLPLPTETGAPAQARADALTVQLTANPNDLPSWLELGALRRSLGDAAGGAAAYRSAVALDPTSAVAHEGLALDLLSQADYVDARNELTPLATQPEAEAILGLVDLESGSSTNAAKELTAALSADASLYSAEDLLALTELQQGDLKAADTESKTAAHLASGSAQALGTLSTVLLFEGKSAAAGAAAKKAIEINSHSPYALLAEGRCLVNAGRYEEARTIFERALAFGPGLWLIHQELAQVYDHIGMPRKAGEEYRAALIIDPTAADSLAGYGETLEENGQYPEAEAELTKSVSIAPQNPSARYYYASLLVDRGHLDEARAQIEAVAAGDPKFGLLYARLAEIYLYKQDLSDAQINALKAVKLLPKSGVAHYELGRVYNEEQHTFQAQQEFRIATVYDPGLSSARYALGVLEEKTQSDFLSAFASIFDSPAIGSPASSSGLSDVGTPGENERVQAALEDPTGVRAATRSYGNTELDAIGGSAGSDQFAGSFLSESDHRQGVIGISASNNFERGPQVADDTTINTSDFIFGHNAANQRVGYLLLGDYQQTNQGTNGSSASIPDADLVRDLSQTLTLTTGLKLYTKSGGDVLLLARGSDFQDWIRTSVSPTDPSYANFDVYQDSLDGEVRWDVNPSSRNSLAMGISYGDRHRYTNSFFGPTFVSFQLSDVPRLSPLQAYIRDDISTGGRWSFVTQLQLLQNRSLDDTNSNVLPYSSVDTGNTRVLPYGIAAYQLNDQTELRLRYQTLAPTVDDFQLLNPDDEFLINYADLLQVQETFNSPNPRGTSTEFEIDKSNVNGGFLSVGLFRQDLINASNPYDGGSTAATGESEGLQASYQGLFNKTLSYFVLAEVQNAEDTSIPERLPGQPNFIGLATLQYQDRRGAYAQLAYYYQGDTLVPNDTETDSGYDAGAFGVLNLRAGKRIGLRTNIFAEVNNALDKQISIDNLVSQGSEERIGISQRY